MTINTKIPLHSEKKFKQLDKKLPNSFHTFYQGFRRNSGLRFPYGNDPKLFFPFPLWKRFRKSGITNQFQNHFFIRKPEISIARQKAAKCHTFYQGFYRNSGLLFTYRNDPEFFPFPLWKKFWNVLTISTQCQT